MRAIALCWPALIIGNRSYIAGVLCVIPTEDNGAVGREFVEKHAQLNEETNLAYSEIKDRISTAFGGSRQERDSDIKYILKQESEVLRILAQQNFSVFVLVLSKYHYCQVCNRNPPTSKVQ